MDERLIASNSILRKAVIDSHNQEITNIPADNELSKMYPDASSPGMFHEKLQTLLNQQNES